jgi:hypothetical protein
MQKKRIAALVRMLSSNHDGEVLAAVSALRKMCSLNDLGNLIEGTKQEGAMTEEEMKLIYDTGYELGYEKGLLKGKEDAKRTLHDPYEDIFDNSSEEQRVLYCQKHKEKLTGGKDRAFVDNMVNWSTVLHRRATPAQLKWLNDIYRRLGGV